MDASQEPSWIRMRIYPMPMLKHCRRHSRLLLAAASSLCFVALSTSTAFADDDCPAGSFQKSEDGFTWCQPSVCANDGQCKPTEVCRPIPLCMEIGSLADAGAPVDAGSKRLAVTQRCAPDKTCPQKQTCSDLQRCVAKTTAEKMGILTASSASSPSSNTEPAKKSSCGCRAVGSTTEGSGGSGALGVAFALGLIALERRRRARR